LQAILHISQHLSCGIANVILIFTFLLTSKLNATDYKRIQYKKVQRPWLPLRVTP